MEWFSGYDLQSFDSGSTVSRKEGSDGRNLTRDRNSEFRIPNSELL